LVAGAVEGEAHRLGGLAAVDVVDQDDVDLLRHLELFPSPSKPFALLPRIRGSATDGAVRQYCSINGARSIRPETDPLCPVNARRYQELRRNTISSPRSVSHGSWSVKQSHSGATCSAR